VFSLLVAGCASAPKSEVKGFWLPASQEAWSKVPDSGLTLRRRDGVARTVPAVSIRNLVAVKAALEQASSVHADLGLVELDSPNAFAFDYQGRPAIAFSISWLDKLGDDKDALATTIGHELAHIALGHTGDSRKNREQAASATSQVLGIALNLTGVPLGSAVASVGVTAFTRSFSRDEERAADDYGLRWAVAAGFDPCGRVRTMNMYRSLGNDAGSIPFLSTHPGAAERSKLADDYARKMRGRACDG